MANNSNDITNKIHSRKLKTIQEFDIAMEKKIADGYCLEEPEPAPQRLIFPGIGCPNCGWNIKDMRETKSDDDGKKYRHCSCFKCGNRVWRRTP